ncbi:MAG: tetratricopeptide repeat protein [Chloroflexales bacterium]
MLYQLIYIASTFMSTPSSPTQARYRIYLSEQSTIEVDIDTNQPISQVAGALAQQHGLPGPYDTYTFFGTDRRPLIRQLSLARTPNAQGGDLYLAQNYAPWWLQALPDGSVPAAPGWVGRPPTSVTTSRPLPIRMIALGGIAVVTLGALVWLLWPRDSAVTATAPTDQGLPPISQSTTRPTATLVAVMPTNMALPTSDPATQASENYQSGLIAYDKHDWETASGLLQQVYDHNPSYLNITDVLSSAYYNWGMAVRDKGDIAGAKEHFAAALRIMPNHQLASAELEKAQTYLDAQAANAASDVVGTIEKFRALLKLQSDYADGSARLYDALITRASAIQAEGGAQNLQHALTLYNEAAELAVPDHSAADTGITTVKALMPTPAPRPTAKPAQPSRLRFGVLNYNDAPNCISVGISGVNTGGWYFTVDGLHVSGSFDTGGNARACGLGDGQEVTITVHYPDGSGVAGGMGVPSKGSAIMAASWR